MGSVCLDDSTHRLQFNDNALLDDHVETVYTDDGVFVFNVELALGFNREAAKVQFMKQSPLIYRLDEARAEYSVYLHY